MQQTHSCLQHNILFSSVTQSCLTLCDPMDCSTPGFPVHHQLPELTQIHVHWVGDAIQPSYPLSSSFPPAFNLSQHQGLFKWVFNIRWPKYWSFRISPSNEYSGLFSFRMDWLGLLAVQGTLKSLLQHHSSKASILRHSAFFIVQLSYPYMTLGKTKAFFFFSPFIFISWRLITLQYCSGFCHTLTWISHGFTCIPHPDPLSHLPKPKLWLDGPLLTK